MITTTRYEGTFSGAPELMAQIRAGLREFLDGCPRVDDAVLITSELAANAALHSDSRGRTLTVRAEVFPGCALMEVEDMGGPWLCRQQDGRPHGLDIVAALASSWGTRTAPDGGRVVWARVDF